MDQRSKEGERGPSRRAGTPPEEAVDLARVRFSVGAAPGEVRASAAEVFSPPRVTAAAARNPRLGALPAGAFDARPGVDGSSWDFSKPEGRDLAIRLIGARRPYLLVGSP
eukprot:5138077-Alexandrium_andersonii.AAC.1